MLAGVTGEMVSSASFLGSPFGMSLGGDELAWGGMENSWPDEPAPAKFKVMAIGVEVADWVVRFRTTEVAIDDLRLEAGFFEESSSLGDALRLVEMTGVGVCWV